MIIKYVGEITDPIHKFIRFTEVEKKIIDTKIFQRLRRIRQLAGAHLVYPSAQHSRFEHSLGTMHLAGLAAEVLFSKNYINEEDIQKLRLAALLHDIGHGPFSHLFEEVMANKTGMSHEDLGKEIITKTEINDIVKKFGQSPRDICDLSFGNYKTKFFNDLISGGLSVDIMDYLPRDSYFTGTEYGKLDYYRLISSMEISSKDHLGINKSSIYSLESMLISRYEMFKAVYFHKTVRSAEVMLLHSMILADNDLNLSNATLEEYLLFTDETLIDDICSLGDKNSIASELALDYRGRKLLKCIYEKFFYNKKRINKITYNRRIKKIKSRLLENANVSEEDIYIDLSVAPSMPLTPKKDELSFIILIDKEQEFETPIHDLPLFKAMTGFLDMVRVYSNDDNREKFKNVDSIF